MSPASKPSEAGKMFPAAHSEDQEKAVAGEMGKVVVGIPPFSSPQPHTDGHRMVSVGGGTAEAQASADEDKSAADWKDEIDKATTVEEVDAIATRYEDSGADFKTVDQALDKKTAELTES